MSDTNKRLLQLPAISVIDAEAYLYVAKPNFSRRIQLSALADYVAGFVTGDIEAHIAQSIDVHGATAQLNDEGGGVFTPRLIQNDAAGQFEVGVPTANNHAATKKYVDDEVTDVSGDVTTVANDLTALDNSLGTVAKSNSYDDLDDQPDIVLEPQVTSKTSSTGASIIPAGTTAQRDGTPAAGYVRFNTSEDRFEGYNGSRWAGIGGGATGGGADEVFVENSQEVTVNYEIPAGRNASSTGPIEIAEGVEVTIPSGSRWVIL